jgi:hypothetical protein
VPPPRKIKASAAKLIAKRNAGGFVKNFSKKPNELFREKDPEDTGGTYRVLREAPPLNGFDSPSFARTRVFHSIHNLSTIRKHVFPNAFGVF